MRMRSLLIGLAVLAILLVVVGWLDRPGSSGTPRDSPELDRLSVTVDNGHTRAREGDRLTYTTRVRNDDPRGHRLQVTQMLPAALRVISATGDGTVTTREVSWDVLLAPGEERALRAIVEVGASREGFTRLATTSCVGLPGQPPSSCADDTDPLTVTSTPAPSTGRLLLTSGLALILVVGVVAMYAVGGESPVPRAATGTVGSSRRGRLGGLAHQGAGVRVRGGSRSRIRTRRGRPAGSRKGVPVPTRVADPVRAWVGRVNGMIAASCRGPWPAPSWFVRVRNGRARSPPSDQQDAVPSVR